MVLAGEHMWVIAGGTIHKIIFEEGRIVDTYDLSFEGTTLNPSSMCFDGENVWIGDRQRAVIAKVNPDDGQVMQMITVAQVSAGIHDLASDGENTWALVADQVVKLRASDGELLGRYDVGDGANRLRHDGTYIWVTNSESDILIRF
jgi:hypothetical protein